MVLKRAVNMSKAAQFFAAVLTFAYQAGWVDSGISASITAISHPARAPPKCPTKSTLGEIVDIMMQLSIMKPNHKKMRGLEWPRSSQVSITSANHTPNSEKPLVEAPTASFMGSKATERRLPMKPPNI